MKHNRNKVGLVFRYVILILWTLICIVPIIMLLFASFKEVQLFQTVPEIFNPLKGFTLENYARVFKAGNYFFFLRNSMIISFSALFIVLIVCVPMAYGITRLPSVRTRMRISFIILSTRFIPYVVIALPLYFLFLKINITGTFIGIILAHLAMQMPFIVYIMMGSFATISEEVEDAALVDGCNPFQVFWKISVPMVLSTLTAAAILAFIMSYNEFLFAFFLGGYNAQPLTVGIARFAGGTEYGAQYGIIAAFGVPIIIPIIIFAIIVNKYIVSGLTEGAIK